MSTQTLVYYATVAISVAIVAYIMQQYGRGTEKPQLLLGVCIMSARDHQEQRAAIRDTWFTADEGGINRTSVKFVVGDAPCPVHPADRVDRFGCQEWTPTVLPDMERDFEAFTVEGDLRTGPSVSILSIRVMHPVILKRIGILESVLLSKEPLVVSAYKDFDEEEMASAKFSLMDSGIVHKGYRYQPVQPVMLEKGGNWPK